MGGQASGRVPKVDVKASFESACRAAGLTHDQVARLMDLTPEHLYQMLLGDRHLPIGRVLQLRDDANGRKFLRAYWPLVGADMGLPEFADGLRVADALQRFIDGVQCRMEKVELVRRDDEGKKTA